MQNLENYENFENYEEYEENEIESNELDSIESSTDSIESPQKPDSITLKNQINFTHLHLHSEYSLLDGLNKIEPLILRIKELGMSSVSLTDHGNMHGALEFYTTALKHGIKPIIGMEAYIQNSEDIKEQNHQRWHLCLYAKNYEGYKNLMYLSSQACLFGTYYKPRITKKLLRQRREGLICSGACLSGEVQWHLNTNKRNVEKGAKGYARAKEVALEYKDIFGEDFYLELMRHGINDQEKIDAQIIQLSKECGIKLIATNDTHYTYKKDASAQEVLFCIGSGKNFNDPNRLRHSVQEFYIKSPQELAALYADMPEILENTQEIANKCDIKIPLKSTEIKSKSGEIIIKNEAPTPPRFKFTKEYSQKEGLNFTEDSEYFAYKCRQGLQKRLQNIEPNLHQKYKERLEYEINIINQMKFPGYMLIVWDFVRAAKELGIPTGPGRGSAAGALVAYCLWITNIDPIKHDLLFERFLNPERVSMPDIDMDFCQSRRGEIINYVVEKYGRYNVAQVATFGMMKAKQVLRDVARVWEMPIPESDKFAKMIPQSITINGAKTLDVKLKDALAQDPAIQEYLNNNELAAKIWEYALVLENTKRNLGVHAAAVVIDPDYELWHKVPLTRAGSSLSKKLSAEERAENSSIIVQYNMKYLEPVDLVKFDFLGLKTLTLIDSALKQVKSRHGIEINLDNLDINDQKVYETIQSGDTLGIFQIESDMFQGLNKRLRPSCFEDIVAIIALGRPGPMQSGMVDDFINRKHGLEPITYAFKELEPILAPTYGTIVYQEQVMQIVQAIGGFSLGGADLIRRAMGKKDAKIMADNKEKFIQGAIAQNLDGAKAADLWDLIVKFAGYGFNKSHSAAYAMLTFQTAFFKTYYPREFMAALLTSEKNNSDSVAKYIEECRKMDIPVLAPSIQKSAMEFSVYEVNGVDSILFGLGAIKGAGSVAIDIVLHEREQNGEFKDIINFLNRIDPMKVNKKAIESFTKSGAMDCFGYSRKAILSQVEKLTEAAKKGRDAREEAEGSLFGNDEEITGVNVEIKQTSEYELSEILAFEKESTGFYISAHPLDKYRDDISKIKYTPTNEIQDKPDGAEIILIGKIEKITEKISKKGNKFAVLSLMDFIGTIELTIFEKDLEKIKEMLEADSETPLAFKCAIQEQNEKKSPRFLRILDLQSAQNERLSNHSKNNSSSSTSRGFNNGFNNSANSGFNKNRFNEKPQNNHQSAANSAHLAPNNFAQNNFTPDNFAPKERQIISLLLEKDQSPECIDLLKAAALQSPGEYELHLLYDTPTRRLVLQSGLRVSPEIKTHYQGKWA